MIVFLCKPKDCKIEVEIVRSEVKNTPMERMESRGAALATETGSLKSNDNIGPDKIAMPIAHGIEIIEENFKQECIVFIELAFLAIRSSSVEAFLIAANEDVKAGVKEEAIGCINAEGKCAIVTASVL